MILAYSSDVGMSGVIYVVAAIVSVVIVDENRPRGSGVVELAFRDPVLVD
jgi:hypothetical protein